jgi:hypothetical protein
VLSRRGFLAGLAARPRARIRVLTEGPQHHFFGYYGVSPWDRTGRRMVCLETAFQNRMPRPGETATILLVDAATGATNGSTHIPKKAGSDDVPVHHAGLPTVRLASATAAVATIDTSHVNRMTFGHGRSRTAVREGATGFTHGRVPTVPRN